MSKLHYIVGIVTFLLLGIMACEIMDGKKNPPYQDKPSTGNLKDNSVDNDGYPNTNRDIMEQPNVVIEKMGDLTGKTVADIGAGYGFYAFRLAMRKEIKKVLALDIDLKAIEILENFKKMVPPDDRERVSRVLETRLVEPDDPKLKDGEADIILLANIAVYFEDPVAYFKNLNKALAKGGKLVIVDYKKRKMAYGPPDKSRIALWKLEKILEAAGYTDFVSDDTALEFQYIITVQKFSEDEQAKKEPGKTRAIDWMDIDGNREIWQQPDAVIRKMGSLKDKTVVDIGAGPYGYFAVKLAMNQDLKKVIALDIDKQAIMYMDAHKQKMDNDTYNRFETRLVKPDDPMLQPGEADVILIANTAAFFEDRVAYFANLKKGLADDGILLIVDFKKRKTPITPLNYNKVAIGDMENDLMKAGYKNFVADDRTLQYQYIITAKK